MAKLKEYEKDDVFNRRGLPIFFRNRHMDYTVHFDYDYQQRIMRVSHTTYSKVRRIPKTKIEYYRWTKEEEEDVKKWGEIHEGYEGCGEAIKKPRVFNPAKI